MLKSVLIQLVKFYQLAISPHFNGRCRFHPTCSRYAIEVLSEHSLLKAIFLIAKRIAKCHPLGPYGVDLPPTSISSKSAKELKGANNGQV